MQNGPMSQEAVAVEDRRSALYEIVYLVVVINLYVSAFLIPLLGGITGAFLLVGGVHPATKRVGKIAMICAVTGGVVIAAVVALIASVQNTMAAAG